MNLRPNPSLAAQRSGSVFILVLWIAFGLVVLALYFGNSMNFEAHAADNRTASLEAEHAIGGAARYVTHVLKTSATNGAFPRVTDYASEAVPVGDATFWILGRGDGQTAAETHTFGLADESAKLNLNSPLLTADMLTMLPGMTLEFAAAILDWRDTNSDINTNGGAENETYQRIIPPRQCKNTNFESIDELRLVYGATLDVLHGEDVNRNGILDLNENDGDLSLPQDNRDGQLDAGLLEYVTVYSRQLNKRADGSSRTNIGPAQTAQVQTRRQVVNSLTQLGVDSTRVAAIRNALQPYTNQTFRSTLEFYIRSQMTADEFALIEDNITASAGNFVDGLVNVNTASETVLNCIPGIGTSNASVIISYRLANAGQLTSIAWVKELISTSAFTTNAAITAGRYLTGQSYQFTADIAALGHHDRGFQRVKFVFDTTEEVPKIIYRQDLTRFGWALGAQVREDIQLAKDLRP